MMKVGIALNPELEFYVTLAGKAEGLKGEMVFERFSDFVLKHLDVQLGWLGWVDLADPERHFSSSLHVDQLQYQPWNPRPRLEKFMLAGWIESMGNKEKVSFFTEILR